MDQHAMDLLWRALYGVAIGSLVWLCHSSIGRYPDPLPKSACRGRDLRVVFLLWGVALLFPVLATWWISPWLNASVADGALRELAEVPLRTAVYLGLPLLAVRGVNGWRAAYLGLRWRTDSWSVAAFALAVGLVSGGVAYATGHANIAIDVLAVGELIVLLYNNAFTEEFYHRGVIQSLLETVVGQRQAILWGGVLFGLTHVALDISALRGRGGIPSILLAVLLQTMAGWLFAIIFVKTRSLWPGIACHYLANWLPSILVALAG